MTTVILSQFRCPTPYWLSQEGNVYPWIEFMADVEKGEFGPARIATEDAPSVSHGYVAFRADAHGNTQVWKSNIDSSD